MLASTPRALALAIANFLAYTLNTVETFGIGPFSSRFGPNQDNASISNKYQTVITPHGIAFSIWAIIFISEAIFVVMTIWKERERNHALFVDGVSFLFVAVCLAQFAWSPAFAYERIPLSAILMGCIFLPLLMIAVRQYKLTTEYRKTNKEDWKTSDYWLLQFPFEIHLGWISAAFVLNLNIVSVYLGASAETQVIGAAISLTILACVAFACLALKMPQFTLPWVVVWATFWISYELRNPKQTILDTFSSDQIHSFFISTRVISAIIALAILVRWIHYSWKAKRTSEESAVLLRRDVPVS